MATDVKTFTCSGSEITAADILSAGEFFSGSIYHNYKKNSWTCFKLVNKKKMSYILNEIKLEKGVQIEIFAYASYPKNVQRPSDWEKFK